MKFQVLFSLDISNSYYSGSCRDFNFLIPVICRQQLKNYRLIHKVQQGNLNLLCEVDGAGIPLISAAGQTLRFGLQLNNPHFTNFTELDFDLRRNVAVYQNKVNPIELNAPMFAHLIGSRLLHSVNDNSRPVSINLNAGDGTFVSSQTLTATEATTVSLDLTQQSPGHYQVTAVHPNLTETTDYYLMPDLLNQDVFGIVEIAIAPDFYSTPAHFTIAFTAKTEPLQYYIVADRYSDSEFNQLSVLDAGFTEEIRPEIEFSKIASADFTTAELDPNLLGPETSHIALFRSQTAVARQSRGRKKIQLHKNGDVLIPHLPQPGAGAVNSDLIVRVAKP